MNIKEQIKKTKKILNDDISENLEQIVSFYLEEQLYGIEITNIIEVVPVRQITRLIHVPSFVKGLMNIRGSIIGVIDIKVLLDLNCVEDNSNTKIIIVKHNDKEVGLMVDQISEIQLINRKDILPVPPTIPQQQQAFLKGVVQLEDIPLMIFNIEEILFCEASKQFEEE